MNEVTQQQAAPRARGEWVELGAGLRGYYARPDGKGPFPAVLVYIEAFGLNDHFKRLTERFADAGFATITPDFYGGAIYPYSDLPSAVAHMKRLDDDAVMAQTTSALDFLKTRAEAKADAVGVVGFCMGGRYTFLANAALASRFKAAVSYYGGGIAPAESFLGRKHLLDRVAEMQAPMLLWYGGADQFIRPDEHARIAEALSKAGKQYTLTVFPRVTHGFFCEDRGSYDAEAARRSFRTTIAFFQEYLSS